MPKCYAGLVANHTAANWAALASQCMNAARKAGTNFCEDLSGPGYNVLARNSVNGDNKTFGVVSLLSGSLWPMETLQRAISRWLTEFDGEHVAASTYEPLFAGNEVCRAGDLVIIQATKQEHAELLMLRMAVDLGPSRAILIVTPSKADLPEKLIRAAVGISADARASRRLTVTELAVAKSTYQRVANAALSVLEVRRHRDNVGDIKGWLEHNPGGVALFLTAWHLSIVEDEAARESFVAELKETTRSTHTAIVIPWWVHRDSFGLADLDGGIDGIADLVVAGTSDVIGSLATVKVLKNRHGSCDILVPNQDGAVALKATKTLLLIGE